MDEVFTRLNVLIDKIESQQAITAVLLKEAHSAVEEAIAHEEATLASIISDTRTI